MTDLHRSKMRNADETKPVARLAGSTRAQGVDTPLSVVELREKLQLAQGDAKDKRR